MFGLLLRGTKSPADMMASPRAADHYDPARIRVWLADEPSDTVAAEALDTEEQRLTSHLCEECVHSFRYAVKISKFTKELPLPIRRNLERSGSSLVLWAEGYGVVKGKLNDVLSASPTLERSLLRLLKSIGRTLSDRESAECRMEFHRLIYCKGLIPNLASDEGEVHVRTSLLRFH